MSTFDPTDVDFVSTLVRRQGEELLRVRRDLEDSKNLYTTALDTVFDSTTRVQNAMRSSSKLQLRFMTMKSDLAKLHTEHEDTVAELEAACMDLHAVLGLFRTEDVTPLPPSQPETPSPQVTEPAPDLVSQSLDDTSTESSFSDVSADEEEPHECTPRFETRSAGHVITAPADSLGLNEETYSFVHADSMLESSIGTARMLSPHAPARAVVDLNVEPALSTRDGPAILPNGDSLPSLSTPAMSNVVSQSSDASATATQPNGSAFASISSASASLPATATVSTAFPTMTSARADLGSSFALAQEPSFVSPTIKESSGVTNEPTAKFQSTDTSTTPSQSIGPSIISRTYSAPTPSASSSLNSIPTETLTSHVSTPHITSPQSLDSTPASQVSSSISVATLVPQSTSAVGSSSSKTSAVSTTTVTPVPKSNTDVASKPKGGVVTPAPASTDSAPAKSSRKTSNATPAPVVTKPAPTSTQPVNTVSSSSSKTSNAATAPVVTKPTSSSDQPANTVSSSLSSRTSNAATAPAVTKPTPTSTQLVNTVPSSGKTSNGASAPVVKKPTPASKPANVVPSNAVASTSTSSAAPAALGSQAQGPNLAQMPLSVTSSQPICTKLPSYQMKKIVRAMCLIAIGSPETVNYHILKCPEMLFANLSNTRDHTLITVSKSASAKSSDLVKFSKGWRGHILVQSSAAKHLYYLGEYISGDSYKMNVEELELLPKQVKLYLTTACVDSSFCCRPRECYIVLRKAYEVRIYRTRTSSR
ncbi:hypothetical protein C8R42DRAFT_369098 [Lentinula raphanica]|nr:hypothetical protein C8R42DRAFT_369098 [Lentinula raphanica]